MDNPFSREQLKQMYLLITGGDRRTIETMAHVALEESADTMDHIWSDVRANEPERDVFNGQDIKNHAENYVVDMMKDFTDSLCEHIRESKLEVHQKLTTSVNFSQE